MAIDPVLSSSGVRLAATDAAALQRLADGATLEAKVVARLPNGVARLQIGGAVIEAKAPPSLTVGATVTLTVSRTPDGVRLLLAAPPSGVPATPERPSLATAPPASAAALGVGAMGGAPVRSAPPAGMAGQPLVSGASTNAVPTPADAGPASPRASVGMGATPAAANMPNGAAGAAPQIATAPGHAPITSTHPSTVLSGTVLSTIAGSVPTSVGPPTGASGPVGLPPAPGRAVPTAMASNVGVGAPTPATSTPGDGVEPALPPTRPVLNETVHQALAHQDDLAPVMSLAAQALASPAALAKLPVEAQRLMQMLLGLKIETPTPDAAKPKAGLNADALKAAVAASGVFFEQGLAQGKTPGPQGDLKALLLSLSGLLGKGEGEAEAPPAPERPAPPIRRDEPDARGAGRQVSLDPPQALKQLSEAASAALDRVRLLQYASLDGAVDGAPARHDPQPGQAREVMFELPFQVGRETHVVPFKVSREAPERREGEGAAEPVWKLSFAIAVEPIGPVHARLVLRGERLDVRLYAERPEVAARMAAASGELRKALGHEGLLDLDGVTVEPGRPGTHTSGVERRA